MIHAAKKQWQFIRGKAEINMCLPFLMEKSERFTNSILDKHTPNGILVVNEFLKSSRSIRRLLICCMLTTVRMYWAIL